MHKRPIPMERNLSTVTSKVCSLELLAADQANKPNASQCYWIVKQLLSWQSGGCQLSPLSTFSCRWPVHLHTPYPQQWWIDSSAHQCSDNANGIASRRTNSFLTPLSPESELLISCTFKCFSSHHEPLRPEQTKALSFFWMSLNRASSNSGPFGQQFSLKCNFRQIRWQESPNCETMCNMSSSRTTKRTQTMNSPHMLRTRRLCNFQRKAGEPWGLHLLQIGKLTAMQTQPPSKHVILALAHQRPRPSHLAHVSESRGQSRRP